MPGLPSCLIPAVVLLVTLATGSGMAAPAGGASGPAQQCAIATRRAELKLGLPSGLLQAIALTESGRWDGARHRSFAWPWTVTSGVDGAYLDSKAEALARIDALQRAGRDNIDVGCMQVNLHHHPDAFPSLEQALDPSAERRLRRCLPGGPAGGRRSPGTWRSSATTAAIPSAAVPTGSGCSRTGGGSVRTCRPRPRPRSRWHRRCGRHRGQRPEGCRPQAPK